jgi:hypothetical protein
MQYQEILDDVHAKVAPLIGCGRVADYIPGLAVVDPHRFGMALATTDGAVYGVGDWQTPFSIQSVSKVFALSLVLNRDSGRSGDGWDANRPAARSTRCSSWSTTGASRATRSSTPAPWSWSTIC